MNELRRENFDQICRSCLNTTSLGSIFETKFENTSLFDILTELSLMQPELGNELPTKLCESCISEVVRFHTFKMNFLKSEMKLQNLLETEIVNTITICEDEGDEFPVMLEDNTPVIKFSDESDCDSESQSAEDPFVDFSSSDNEDESLRKEYSIPPEMKIQVIDAKTFKKELEKNGYVYNLKLDGRVQIMTEEELKTPKTYVCMCGETFIKYPEYMKHKKEFKHLRTFVSCDICDKTLPKNRLKLHMRLHTNEKPYQCKVCSKQFRLGGNYKRHLRVHTGEKPYFCDICGKSFTQSTSLNSHKLIHTGEKPHCCDMCPRRFTLKALLNQHKLNHIDNTSNETKTEFIVCPVCGKMCPRPSLRFHLTVHNKRKKRGKKYLCGSCGKQFTSKNGLDVHSLLHSDEKRYVCEICGKRFRQSASLYQHKFTHSGEKRHVCQFCGKRFSQATHLKIHMTIHTGEKRHECKFCGKRFSVRENLTVHIRIHTGEKPWVCDVCSKRFYASNALKKHKNVHKKEQSCE